MSNNSENEVKKRRKVVEEKMWGALIELVERTRKKPMAHSIFYRFLFLSSSLSDLQLSVKEIIVILQRKGADSLETQAPSFVIEQMNYLIKTYNSIIKDLHLHFKKKDSYITEFSPFEELNKPTIGDIAKNLFMMGTNVSQILSYMLRWME
jgi:hypothetical protein